MAPKSNSKNKLSLARGRPPGSHGVQKSISAKVTRTLIRSHHRLHKALADAEKAGDQQKIESLRQQIELQGGLKKYQQASLQGQASDRGGDSSRLLLDWVNPLLTENKTKIRLLEVGALSTSNACSRSNLFSVTRIDLNSQAKGIQQQDFMERPLPTSNEEKFDMLSLSLVVNYVPDSNGRGEMLRRTCKFLNTDHRIQHDESGTRQVTPSLFLVLPAPCIFNSRYMDEARLTEIMESLGYHMDERKLTAKLIYYLWSYEPSRSVRKPHTTFPKKEVNPGAKRNNFSIVLE
ncbi:hypothetical protein MBLNU457_1617t1 [Dothideomycetes sp. NU457]